MKKIYLAFAFLTMLVGTSTGQGLQEGLFEFTKSYFRADPFRSEFSVFVKRLIDDPGYKEKSLHVRTDTSLFYFYGIYSTYNPFFFKPNRIEILLQETPVQYSDSIADRDTILVYQLTAFLSGDTKGTAEVKREFEKIHRRYYKKFFDNNYTDMKSGAIVLGGMHNYFVPFYGLAPLSIAWGKDTGSNESILNITLRLKTSGNEATLPKPLDNP